MDSQSPTNFNGDSSLHVAVRHGQIENVREILIQQQVDVNVLNSKQETPLHLACSKNDSPIVQLLVAFGADPYIKDSNNNNTYDISSFDVSQLMDKLLYGHGLRLWIDGPVQADKESPLHTAVRLGRLDDIQRIIEEKIIDINDTNANHETPLHLASALGNKYSVHILISNGADIYMKDIFNNAPIHRAVSQGQTDTVDYLITIYACNPNIKGYQGRTLLHFACGIGNVKFATTLIEKYGISPMATDAINQTPLHIAASHGQEEVVRLLINKYYSSSLESTDLPRLLWLACSCGHVSVVRTLVLKYKADIDEVDVIDSSVMGGRIEFDLDDDGNTPLHMACLSGHEELARLLITNYNCPVDVKNEKNETPLHKACLSGRSSIVRMLVSEFKADETQRDHNNDTPISKAAEGGHVETVQALITELGCSPKVTGYDGRTLLHDACWSGNIKLAEMLIIDFILDVLSADDSGNTPLHMACLGGHEELARLLITKYNYPIDVKNNIQETPLHIACSYGQSSIVRMLISEFKADATQRDHKNDTAVSIAAEGGHVETVQALITELSSNFKVTGYDGRSLLYEACWSGSIKLAEMLIIDFSLDVMSSDLSGNTTLHMACQGGYVEIARLLITKYNCPVDVKNNIQETPLHIACSYGQSSIVRMLISEFKADATQRDHYNDTAISKAARGGHVETVKTLISCSPRVTGYDGRSLLHEACWSGSIKLVEMLIIDFSLDVLSTDYSGDTPLHMACWGGHEALAKLLITKYNCPVDVKNKAKKTPLHMACSRGHLNVSKMLLSGDDKKNYNPLDNCSNTPLDLLIKRGDTKAVHILSTEYGLKCHVRGAESKPLLHQLAAGGFTTMLQELISKFNYDPACSDKDGNTLLHTAAQHWQYEIAEFVITNHSSQFPIDHRNCQGMTALHDACMHGSARIVKLIANKALGDKDEKILVDERGNTLLHIAAQHGRHEIAELLFTDYSNQCPIDHRNSQGQTALHCACIGGHTRVAKFLIANKADITVRDEDGDTPLKKAFLAGHELTFFELFNSNLRKIDDQLLLQACKCGHVDLIDVLLSDFHLDPSSVLDDQGNKAIHIAALQGHEQVAILLVEKYSCPVDVKNKDKKTPLHIACSCGYLDISKMLITLNGDKRFCNSLDKDNNTPLDLLIKRGNAEAVHILSTEYGLKPHIRGVESKPLLHQLVAGGFTTMLQELISNFEYDSACSDEDGNTILHTAAQHGQYEVAELVITSHSSQFPIDHRNCQGMTALHYACMHGCARIAKLIANKALDEHGNTLLHIAAQHGRHEIAELLFTDYSNQCPIDHRNSQGQTALHCACIGGHTRVAKLLIANKADITVRDEDGDTPLKKAFLTGHELTLFELFNSNLRIIDSKLLRQACERGCIDLVYVLLSDFHLDSSSVLDDQGNKAIHVAALQGHKQVIAHLVKKYKCPIDSRNLNGQTPLHLICSQLPTENGHALIRMCISEFKAGVTTKDNNGDHPIHAAVQAGHTSTVVSLILEHHVSPNSRGFKERSLLHHALANGHTLTAKILIDDFHLSLHCVDEDGNTPLHLSSLVGQIESLRFLLYEYHAPVYVRNKAGKTALDLATEDSTKVIREYVKSEYKRIQYEYENLRAKSLQKYSGQQVIIRVFILGNPGSGKSTLVESLKRKGIISSLFTVTETDVPPHTVGIVPSVHQSKETGRLLYYDFAGDQEYYSSHAAILEMVSRSTVGSNVFLIVADLTKDDAILKDEIGYWLSFISYHGKALDNQCKLKVIIVLSHSDRLSVADSDSKVESARQFLYTHINQCNEVKFDAEIISSNCRSPRSSRSVASILQQISKDTLPCSISYEASLLHGLLENDFGNVVACTFQNLLSSIEETGIYLPSSANALHPIVRELHDIGLLMLIGQSEDELEDYLLLLNPSSLTKEIHEKLFSSSAVKRLESSIGPHFANMGILPESSLASILPEHITKECLVQLQYCQEFNHAEVGLDYSVTSNDNSDCNLLYFPALCKLDSKKSSWHNDPKFTSSIGWYAECREKFDYFPARFLHVLLLRLAYAFALPIVNRNPTNSSNEVSAYSRRCTMWKNGIHWRMEEGVECIVEVVNDNKGIAVITKYKENSEKWATILGKIIDKTMQAKAEVCNAVSLHHFVLKSGSDDTASYSNPENLFDIGDIERVIRQLNSNSESDLEEVLSADRSGSNSLNLRILHILKQHSCWGLCDMETQVQPTGFEQKLDQVLDFESGGVSTHLGQIADAMHEWEGPIAEQLGLTRADVAAIKTKYPGELKLQTREALEQWKQKSGPNATYRNLIDVFNKAAGYREYVETVYKLFC